MLCFNNPVDKTYQIGFILQILLMLQILLFITNLGDTPSSSQIQTIFSYSQLRIATGLSQQKLFLNGSKGQLFLKAILTLRDYARSSNYF